DGLPVPLQLQVLEADHLDSGRTEELRDGGFILQGIEFDALGRRRAYWLYPTHPGDGRGALVSHRVPAERVLHLFERLRPGQVRGVPWFAPVMLKLRDLDAYDEAELVRKKIEACFVAFVTTGDDRATLGDLKAADDGGPGQPRNEKLAPGLIKYLKPDESVEFGNPTPTASGGEFTRRQLHAIAAGCRMTYAQLTGDYSQSNFSSSRMGLIEFRQMMDQQQWLVFVPQMVKPIRRWFREAAETAGKPIGSAADKITMPRRHYIDPLKDVAASKEEVRGGAKTLSEWIREQGEDPDATFAERAAELQKLKALGIVVDTDPTVQSLKRLPGDAGDDARETQ
ncbi:MAG TPA: phage portal protein, partial [Burkholderiaceae bacterium]|nr:phage portal protein [Burkholderiaceae bacterium]